MRRVILGCEGYQLTEAEKDVFKECQPAGLILFTRNCKTPSQLRELTEEFRETVGDRNRIVMIDEEGGNVQRMIPPEWESHPPMSEFGKAYKKNPELALELLRMNCQAIASKLHEAGINTVAAPVIDLLSSRTHKFLASRCFSDDPEEVGLLGATVSESFISQGILPIIKHMPGHGRAEQDSHHDLPQVEESTEELWKSDFLPFTKLASAPLGMTAHIAFKAVCDETPLTFSPQGFNFIRESLGFKGLLMTDCIYMEALPGKIPERASKAILAGADLVLSCHGDFAEKRAVAMSCPAFEKPLSLKFNNLFNLTVGIDIQTKNHKQLSTQVAKRIKELTT